MMDASIFEEELEHIPEGPPLHPQHLFRLMYRIHRMHSFHEETSLDARRRALIESCSKIVKESFPDFEPTYDRKYFFVAVSE